MAKSKDKSRQQDLVNDAAKALLANIRFMSIDEPIKTIAITSSIPNEGKTFVSVNLAQAIASSGKTCLLLEGDLRKRSLAAAMGIHPEHGLHSVLSGEVPFSQAAVTTPQRNLFFLDAEPQIPNPSDLFGSLRFSEFLAQVSAQVDYIVIDTPPVTTFVDAAVIGSHVDKVFLVVRENFTKGRFVQAAYEQLLQAGASLGGVVMNGCEGGSDSYYNYYNYYNYYHEDEAASKSEGGSHSKKKQSAAQAATPGPVAASQVTGASYNAAFAGTQPDFAFSQQPAQQAPAPQAAAAPAPEPVATPQAAPVGEYVPAEPAAEPAEPAPEPAPVQPAAAEPAATVQQGPTYASAGAAQYSRANYTGGKRKRKKN